MSFQETEVALHYRHGALEAAIRDALAAAYGQRGTLTPADLKGADEFHIGAAQATDHLLAQLNLEPGDRLLDIGCGPGGTARHIAAKTGCHVTGIDLSAEYAALATSLSRQMGLTKQLAFIQGEATALPFADGAFDHALILHVGMNIADKQALFAEAGRVLRSQGQLAIYDVMRTGPGPLRFPLPWSGKAETTALEPPEAYCAMLERAGFEITATTNRAAFARRFFAIASRQLLSVPLPLGMELSQIIMGGDLPAKIDNMSGLLDQGTIAPIEIIARRRH